VPQGSVLGPLLSVFPKTTCAVLSGIQVAFSLCLLFVNDAKIYLEIKSPYDSRLLQSDTNCVRVWCISTYVKLNVNKTRVISCHRKKQTGLVLNTNCVNLLTHSRTASEIWDCLYTQSYVFANR